MKDSHKRKNGGVSTPVADLDPATLTRRERRKLEVHDRIVDAALELFNNRGLTVTTIHEICERADVAEKTFFNHFPTRQHLVEEIAEVLFLRLQSIVDESRRQPGTIEDRLAYFFDRVAVAADEIGPMHREVIREVIRSANMSQSQEEKTRRLEASLRTLIERAVQAGEVSRRYSAEFLSQMVLNSFFGIMSSWISVDEYPLRKHAAEAAHFLGDAIRRA